MTEPSAARCWFIVPLDLLAAGVARLSQPILLWMGYALSWLLWPGMGKRRRYARINIALCFPELDDAQRKRLLRDNLRATVTTTAPNFVRGAVVPMTSAFLALGPWLGLPLSAITVGAVTIALALGALGLLDETYGKDLDYLETDA
jgi:hypothetical protein